MTDQRGDSTLAAIEGCSLSRLRKHGILFGAKIDADPGGSVFADVYVHYLGSSGARGDSGGCRCRLLGGAGRKDRSRASGDALPAG